MKLLFVLGNHPELSLAELQAILKSAPLERAKEFAIFDSSSANAATLQNRLAGTVKIAEVLGETIYTNERDLADHLQQYCPNTDGKVIFGASVYGESGIKPMRIGLELKKFLRGRGVKVRLVTSNNKQLSAADLLKNKILEHGFEFLLFPQGKKVLLARTLSFQPLEYWADYDMNRPARDMKRGMLPPKLARLMVNLSGASHDSVLLDPFCGTGTVLEQAAEIGVGNIIGSDIDPKAIEDSKTNFAPFTNKSSLTLHVSAAKNLSALIDQKSVTHIVTEPLLGKPRTGRETMHELKKEIETLEDLYAESFAGLKRTLVPGAITIVSLPRHYLGQTPMTDRFIEMIERAGYKKQEEHLYKHKDQFVGRNIVRFSC